MFMSGKGTWLVSNDGDALTGSYRLYATSFGNVLGTWNYGDVIGNWNFRKIETEPAQVVDISGTYISEVTGDNQTLPFYKIKSREVKLVQNGNYIKGSYGESGRIYGNIEGNTISFEWQKTWAYGKGEWTVKPGGNEIVGKWHTTGGPAGSGKWNLTKIETTPPLSLTGTYIADISGGRGLMRKFMRRPATEIKLEVELVQNGNQITITYDGERGKIYGDIDGDTILIDWSNDGFGKGKLTVKPGSNELVGIFYSTGSGGDKAQGNGELNLTRIE
jgi:hypothetical protein